MVMGVTQNSPNDWAGENPREMDSTWCLDTYSANIYFNGCGMQCDPWIKRLGHYHHLSVGDTLSLTLCENRYVSIKYNDTRVSNVFEHLPSGPLWVVMEMNIDKMEIIQPNQGKFPSNCFCLH